MRSISREISVAEERGYLDTTLAAPLARWVLVAGSSTVTALASGGVVAVVLALTMIVGIAADTGISLAKLIAGVANVWPLAVFSAGLAVLVAGFLHKSAPVTVIATGTVVGMYVVDLAGKLADPAEPFRWVTVFKYYGSGLTEGIDPTAFIGLTVCGVALASAGSRLFGRRDVLA